MIQKIGPGETKLYGASDDLIEIESHGGQSDEIGCYESPGRHVWFSDGTILHIEYGDEGMWRIALVEKGSNEVSIWKAVDADSDQYSDVATIKGKVTGWKVTKRKWKPKT